MKLTLTLNKKKEEKEEKKILTEIHICTQILTNNLRHAHPFSLYFFVSFARSFYLFIFYLFFCYFIARELLNENANLELISAAATTTAAEITAATTVE